MDARPPCFLCANRFGKPLQSRPSLSPANNQQTPLLTNLAWSWAESLCEILELDRNYMDVFVGITYCAKCQETLCNIDFTVKTISRLQTQFSLLRDDLKSTLLQSYNSIMQIRSEEGWDVIAPEEYDNSIENIIKTIQLNLEPADTDHGDGEYILPSRLPFPIQSSTLTSYIRVPKNKRRRGGDPLESRVSRKRKQCIESSKLRSQVQEEIDIFTR